MPELPEVETVRRQLSLVLVDKVVTSIEVLKKKSWSGDFSLVIGQRIQSIERRSKILQFVLSNGMSILAHLKMSGQFIYVDGEKRIGGGHPSLDWTNALPSSHTRVSFSFDDGTQLFFNDQRIFGWMRLMTQTAVDDVFQVLAPDIIDTIITPQLLFEKIHTRGVPIKVLIMDNTIVAGVGNIYACDGLNLARISPFHPGSSLTFEETATLLESLKSVIFLGIEKGGATIDGKYVHVTGLSGTYQNVMRVYGKEDQPCPNCGSLIVKKKLASRGTYYCEVCQI